VAAVGLSAAAFLQLYFPLAQVPLFILLIVVSTVIVVFTNYNWLERFFFIFGIILAAMGIVSLLVGFPSVATINETAFNTNFIFENRFLILVVSAVGLAPTALDTTFSLGSWSMEKNEGAQQLEEYGLDPENKEYHDYIASWINTGLRDFRLGYFFSYFIAIAFILLGTTFFYPAPPTNENIAAAIGSIFRETLGIWGFYLATIAAFSALWSTVMAPLDGGARATLDILQQLVDDTKILRRTFGNEVTTERGRQITAVLFVIGSLIPILIFGSLPVTLVVFFGVALALFEVYIYPANLYIVRNDFPSHLQPSKAKMIYYFVGIIVITIFSILGAMNSLGLL
jgi:Mn2+/Fe2+ NRAMP family transporter